MHRSRRTFLRSLAVSLAAPIAWLPVSDRVRAGILGGSSDWTAGDIPRATLDAFLETLIPDDDLTPGAVALGVSDKLLAVGRQDREFRRLLYDGCRWLDTRAYSTLGAGFAGLNEQQRSQLVETATRAPVGSLPRDFFQATWDEALFHYYAEPGSWPGLAIERPPQPLGYPGHTNPPGKSNE